MTLNIPTKSTGDNLTANECNSIVTDLNIMVGTIQAFATDTPPSGFLECDGSTISRTTYSSLFTVIGTRWGYGDQSTTFNVPDLRGMFPRGWAHGTSRDPDRSGRNAIATGGNSGDNVGSYQGYAVKTHEHRGTFYTATGGYGYGAPISPNIGCNQTYWQPWIASQTMASASTSTGESRPINVNVMWCVKY